MVLPARVRGAETNSVAVRKELAAKMEKREQLVLTFYNPKVPKLKGNRNYQRVRRYLITIRSDGRKRTYLKVGLDSVLEIEITLGRDRHPQIKPTRGCLR